MLFTCQNQNKAYSNLQTFAIMFVVEK